MLYVDSYEMYTEVKYISEEKTVFQGLDSHYRQGFFFSSLRLERICGPPSLLLNKTVSSRINSVRGEECVERYLHYLYTFTA
jgi:hypothetical protein